MTPGESAAGIAVSSVSREELLRRAAALVPVLEERAARTEELRQVLPENVRDLLASELIRIGNPRRYGGHDAEVDTAYEVGFELGRGCGSTAWCYSLWTAHNWWLGHFPERCQDEFFATGPDTLFSSGCDAATWVMVAVPGSRPTSLLWLLLPRSDYQIVDTWFASGMRGSGSKDIVIAGAFVPAHRAIDPDRSGAEDMTGWELHGRLSYRAPLRCLAGWDLAAPLIGIAQGAADAFAARAQRTSGPGRAADSVALQLRLAEAAAEVDAARALHRQDIREILDRAARGAGFTELDRIRYRRDKAFIARLCVRAVDRLFEGSGARAVLDTEPIQRFHRDAHGASHHAALSWDLVAEQFGRQAMGLGTSS